MNKIKEIVSILLEDRYIYQKLNYIRCLLSRKAVTLVYKPITISVVSTSNCTLSCVMCPTHSKDVPKNYKWRQTAARDMSLELFKQAAAKFKEALSVQIIGSGEPMLNEDFFKIAAYAHERMKMTVKAFSNGTTIGKNMDNILTSRLDGLTISLNGPDRFEYARITGMDEKFFDVICNDTKELIRRRNELNKKMTVNVSFIVDRMNYLRISDMIKLGVELGADNIFLCNFLPCPHGDLTPEKTVITEHDTEIIFFIRRIKNELDANMRNKVSFPSAIDTETAENRCMTHFRQIRIDGEGNVSSCSMMLLNMEASGKLSEDDPWNNGFFREIRGKIMNGECLDELCCFCPDNKGAKI